MAANLDLLIPELKLKIIDLMDRCKTLGYDMRPYVTIRDPYEQARLWRQSRSTEEINNKIAEFEASKAPFLANCIRSVGPQHGKPVTNAPPGLSWHQWGEAVDCFWLVDGTADWSTETLIAGKNGYHVYAREAKHLGIEAGGLWPTFKDWPHVQLRNEASPLTLFSLSEIDTKMQQKFHK